MTEPSDQDSDVPAPIENQEKGKDNDKASAIEPEVLEKLPPDLRKAVESFSLQAFSAPVFNPILKKINEQHIDKVLDQAGKIVIGISRTPSQQRSSILFTL